jgi:uncharacterized repeat protein (TIGR01451 family)
MKQLISKRRFYFRAMLYVCMALVLILPGSPAQPTSAQTTNPEPYETYFVPLPEDWLMQHMEDIDTDGGSLTLGDPYPPVRTVIAISVSSANTLIYWDQWEDGGYDADIANPGSNIYNAATNPDGTQIWGDGDPTNGYPPRFRDAINTAQRDVLNAGDVIVLDNLVELDLTGRGAGGANRRLWLGSSLPGIVRYDGKDKFGATAPVAATRANWPEGQPPESGVGIPGSLFGDAVAIEPTVRWGTAFITPAGQDVTTVGQVFEYTRATVMAAEDSTFVWVDLDKDGVQDAGETTTLSAGQQFDAGAINRGVPINSSKPVQVILVTGNVGSTWATRWYNVTPRIDWTNDYYTPVGTDNNTPGATPNWGTAVYLYNPHETALTVSYTLGGGGSGTISVPAGGVTASPILNLDQGARFYTTDGRAFFPLSVTEVEPVGSGDWQLFDWGFTPRPADRLSDEYLVGWAPGCTTFSGPMECFDQTSQTESAYTAAGVFQVRSRNVVWVTPLAATTLYVDLDGSGITCPGGAGAERSISATALTSYRIADDPAGSVCDAFTSQSYSLNRCNTNWSAAWDEVNDGTDSASSGAILIDTTAPTRLRFGLDGTDEAGRYIQRQVNLSGNTIAQLKFMLWGVGIDPDVDRLRVDVSPNGGTSWTTLETFTAIPSPNPIELQYDISAYIASNTRIRFYIVDTLETGEYWYLDNVTISFGTAPWDYDMSGARLRTCDGTKFAVAYGQNPQFSYSNDDEALDLGTTVFPLSKGIKIEKSVDKSYVTPGGEVVYGYIVTSTGNVSLADIKVTDDLCSPAVGTMTGGYNVGDKNNNGTLEPGEKWEFTCTSNIFIDTTNTAFAEGTPETEETIYSDPDKERVQVTGAIGDYVWLDEDGDGDQDAGEAGIPNVKVTLTGTDFTGATWSLVTYTDASGGYIFPDMPPGTYTISIDPTSLPAGLAANPTYDENGIGTPHTTTVILTSGEEHMTADFGYNWSSPNETNNNTGTGAIGDRVWLDADGDGMQDPEEIGLYNVEVQLWYDSDGDGIIDALYGTTTTDYNGNYIFDNLPAGIYEVRIPTPPAGYTQTGDPDGLLDNKTTDPIVLGPGDVYVNADFGYQPTGTTSAIGDTIYFDANGNGVENVGEPGIPGVTVALILDLDGDGVWDPGEPIIATAITDENGQYLFEGLPAGNYIVWVNDTQNVLNELTVTGDPYGALDGFSAVSVDGINDNLLQDFGYAPPSHNFGDGLIGDTIYLDRDNDGQYDPGEGLEGVVVILKDAAGNVIARTVTDENGNYSFGNLPAGTYTVVVDTTTLPAGLVNTVDPDGGIANQSTVTLAAGEINLLQDFGYYPTTPNTIGGTIWEDTDADGLLEGTEAERFAGVTVVLRDSDGNIVATTTTDSNGNFLFTGLPDGTYTVDVTDDDNILNGYWHSVGTNQTADNYSKVDPYTVTVGGGQTNTTADFGYYIKPAALGNWVWFDQNNNGIQDPGEPGISGVKVTLTIAWPNGGTTVLTTYTDANGYYSFENLLLDEDYNGIGTGEPTFTITVEKPTNYVPTTIEAGEDPTVDSNNPAGTTALPIQGTVDDTYDFGYQANPTNVDLISFTAKTVGQTIVLTWEMAAEMGITGYNLYRATSDDIGQSTLLHTKPASIPPGYDVLHEYIDAGVELDIRYFYWLEIVYNDERPNYVDGPVNAIVRDLDYQIFLPLIFGTQ